MTYLRVKHANVLRYLGCPTFYKNEGEIIIPSSNWVSHDAYRDALRQVEVHMDTRRSCTLRKIERARKGLTVVMS